LIALQKLQASQFRYEFLRLFLFGGRDRVQSRFRLEVHDSLLYAQHLPQFLPGKLAREFLLEGPFAFDLVLDLLGEGLASFLLPKFELDVFLFL